jgi:TonB family protein
MVKAQFITSLFISVVLHILIITLFIPMFIIQRFNAIEVQLFEMNEEIFFVQSDQGVKKQKPFESTDTKEEITKLEQPQMINETTRVQEEVIREPATILSTGESEHLSLSKNPDPPFPEVRTDIFSPSNSLSEGHKVPDNVKFGAANGPQFLYRELPVYPIIARKSGKEGQVVLKLTIDVKGEILNIEVLESAGYGFTEAAIDAVKKSRFLPAKKDNKPIVSRVILPIRFTLRKDQ